MKTKRYKCLKSYKDKKGNFCFEKGFYYRFYENENGNFSTKLNHFGYEQELNKEEIEQYFTLFDYTHLNTPSHYDNSKGSLYKVANDRNQSPYLCDIVKRLERSEKKGEFKSDLEKSINVIKLWMQEHED